MENQHREAGHCRVVAIALMSVACENGTGLRNALRIIAPRCPAAITEFGEV
jgi:hypothetical protein